MKQYASIYLDYVQDQISNYSEESLRLKMDLREDEANLYKIRANICDIFLKMVDATDKKVASMNLTDEAEKQRRFQEEYLLWFDKIPENWRSNLKLAKKHDDLLTAQAEEIKLETADMLRNKFICLADGEVQLQSGRATQ